MLILHTSDWHLGRTLHGADLGDDADAFLGWLTQLVEEREVDAVLISGDIFDRAVPPVDSLARAHRTFMELSERTQVIMTSGNHDGAARLGLFSGMLRENLHVVTDPLQVGTPIDVGGALIYALPYLEPDLVRQLLSDLPTEQQGDCPPPLPRSHEAVMGAALRRVRAHLRELREAGDERPAIVMVHAFVSGALPTDSERDIQVGGVPSVPASIFDTLGGDEPLAHGVDYVAAGHLHRPQDVGGSSTRIRYSGSPIAYSFSEANYPKSITLIETDATAIASIEEVLIPPYRPIAVLEGRMEELLGDVDSQAAASYVSVSVTDAARPERMVARIREAYPHALIVQHRSSAPSPVAPHASIVAAHSPIEVSQNFYKEVGGRPLNERELSLVIDTWSSVRVQEQQ